MPTLYTATSESNTLFNIELLGDQDGVPISIVVNYQNTSCELLLAQINQYTFFDKILESGVFTREQTKEMVSSASKLWEEIEGELVPIEHTIATTTISHSSATIEAPQVGRPIR